jgi:hypothetical protein
VIVTVRWRYTVTDENTSLQELEIRLKKHEIKLKEAEIRGKELEVTSSKWLNPIAIGLFTATLALIGNIVITKIASVNAQVLEHSRTQSNLLLEALKTNGDANGACRNLIFLVSLGQLDDVNHAITGACPGSVQGVPSISVGPPDLMLGYYWYPLEVQTLSDEGGGVPEVNVEATLLPTDTPIIVPPELYRDVPADYIGTSVTGGKSMTTTVRCTTDKNGFCSLGMAPAGRFLAILAKKQGFLGNRANILFRGTSVVTVLQRSR